MNDRPSVAGQRRAVLTAIAAGLASGWPARQAFSQEYPSRPITLVVPFGPGGSGDITARTFAKYFEKRLNQTVVVENKPGANGILGSQGVKAANADGYTLLMVSNMTHAANSSLYRKLPYDPLKDFEHIGMFGVFGMVLLVPADSPFKSMQELITYSKARPDQVAVGHFNASSQVAAQLLRTGVNIPVKEVGYRAIANAFTDVLGGHIQMLFADYPAATTHIVSGKMIPIAVTELKRSAKWPQLPSMAEFYPGFEIILSLGLAAPAGTPRPALERINRLMVEAVADPDVKATLEKFGYSIRPASIESTRQFLVDETEKWGRYVKAAGIEPQ